MFGLESATTYAVRVQANNAEGASTWTNTSFTTPNPGLPSSPSKLITAAVSGGSVTVSWCPPVDDGGSDPEVYLVRYRQAAGGSWQDVQVPAPAIARVPFTVRAAGVGCTSTTLSGLTPTTQYVVYVVVETEAGLQSQPATLELTSGEASRPSAPVHATVATVTGGAIDMVWSQPTDNGGAPISSFTVWAARDEATGPGATVGSVVVPASAGVGGRFAATVAGLNNNRRYTVSLVAVNSAGKEGVPATLLVSTRRLATPPSACRDVNVVDIGGDFVELAWVPPLDSGGYAVRNYTVEYTTGLPPVQHRVSVESPSVVLVGLVPQTSYTVMVAAVSAWHIGAWSVPSNVTTELLTPPQSPLITGFESVTATSGRVAFEYGTTGGADPATMTFTVFSLDVDTGAVLPGIETDASPVLVPDLVANHTYQFSAVAENLAGSSPPSSELRARHESPVAVLRVRVVKIYATAVHIAWRGVSAPAAMSLVGYQVCEFPCASPSRGRH